jgi:arabinogalactan endo-1,4-beta-galactosidase
MWAVLCIAPARPAVAGDKLFGFDANYVLSLEEQGLAWSAGEQPTDVYRILSAAGGNLARIRVWTADAGAHGLEYATKTALRAQAAGLTPCIVLFLSEDWSDMVKQPAPAAWRGLSTADKSAAIEAYSERVIRHMQAAGVHVDRVEIGNEIDFGLCGVFEEEWPKRVSVEYMRSRIWPEMVPLIRAAQSGVRKASADARFIIHFAWWTNADYCIAFWRYLREQGLAVDVPGISYFPTSAQPEERSLPFFREQVAKMHAALESPVLVCEFAYPSSASFPGQFAEWNKPIDGYALDLAGQERWTADFLREVRVNPALMGAIYWSPEWYRSGMWEAFALFDAQGRPKPALNSFGSSPAEATPQRQ